MKEEIRKVDFEPLYFYLVDKIDNLITEIDHPPYECEKMRCINALKSMLLEAEEMYIEQ
ncbi:MAG: hypothetical protein IJ031_00045 [Oscillospiraceae bacterium]|nr:hypothetical protein [Oscillospiraceae bacterium]MBQ8882980.1 hypothetical protein [Oscillospiraceae bacterium]